MKSYQVIWSETVQAETPEEAARIAATDAKTKHVMVFTVCGSFGTEEVTVAEDQQERK